ncbi:hypothetical protein BCR34DRAFT_667761 [Clohesyomyces aquaticus]|uniref:Uncharacterized protein n=1 Tax=Clohesyomyces aquaticus TaxID=1231657 RepID=A0A1Y1YXA9_9PLEO|nr:hypothetical protein BCR34DRAFT_667761 [Clohesyomyces aquaticus]
MGFKHFTMALLASILTAPCSTAPTLDGEIMYLCHCGQDSKYSLMVYYKDYTKSQSGQQPDAISGHGSGWLQWEGIAWTGTFADGNTFTSSINKDAGGFPALSEAGSGVNKYRGFRCYKDTGRLLFVDSGANCVTNYYCN